MYDSSASIRSLFPHSLLHFYALLHGLNSKENRHARYLKLQSLVFFISFPKATESIINGAGSKKGKFLCSERDVALISVRNDTPQMNVLGCPLVKLDIYGKQLNWKLFQYHVRRFLESEAENLKRPFCGALQMEYGVIKPSDLGHFCEADLKLSKAHSAELTVAEADIGCLFSRKKTN